ncbi:MAG TPA: response regulator [Bacteroidia bacterium]|nr:response regulator [Bacteroidota bacterium]MBP9789915.1 response regulator [Bacteroidia bacterium]MBK7432043.1 response regulator [Bacteroidota bacterium]MBK7570923.1 response regulator [Bacteroidota bacterium]MBK8585609.1 response regulator [Bacteroidota bacterium]
MKTVKTIFIVDDDPMQAMMLQDYLSKYSTFTLTVFNSGEECLKNLDKSPDIVFLDYNFDKAGRNAMDGIEILKEIKKAKPLTEVVMISGQDRIEVAVNTIKYGAFDYIVKSESAFHRSENVIFNIIKRMKLQGEARLYKKLTLLFGVCLLGFILLVVILYQMGYIAKSPGWI